MSKPHSRKDLQSNVDKTGQTEKESSKLAAEVTVGSVKIPIFASINRVKIPAQNSESGDANGEVKYREYKSFILSFYEGSVRKTPRRSTLEKAKEFAREVATRLNREGARAVFISETDRRVFQLAQMAAQSVGMAVDELCRKYIELKRRLKRGTLEQAVDFSNDHGERVQHGVGMDKIYAEYLIHLEKRGAGEYHTRDTKRYVGGFVEAEPGSISSVSTSQLDNYLGRLSGKARSRNNVRDSIIGFFNFAEQKGYLPQGIPHAASLTTEFRDPRQPIETEEQARRLLEPNDIYLPPQMATLLKIAKEDEPDALPSLELKAFSGVRTEEVTRIWWIMISESDRLIRIPDAVGKVDARRVPVLPNLQKRLANHSSDIKSGRVATSWTCANSLYHAWQRVCRKAKIPYIRNAFRNSYFTYRLTLIEDINKVAEEGGTSVGELKKNYLSRASISKAMAEEWFSL